MANDAELTIRKATRTDAKQLLDLLQQLKTESTTFEDTSEVLDVESQAAQIDAIGASNQQLILVAVVDSEIIGLATVLPTSIAETGEIGVAVLKSYWHQGIGTELMLNALDWSALESAFDVITLTVQAINKYAIQLYSGIGFQTTNELQVTDSTGRRVPAYEMQLAVK